MNEPIYNYICRECENKRFSKELSIALIKNKRFSKETTTIANIKKENIVNKIELANIKKENIVNKIELGGNTPCICEICKTTDFPESITKEMSFTLKDFFQCSNNDIFDDLISDNYIVK